MTVSPGPLASTASWMLRTAYRVPPQPPGPACPSSSTQCVREDLAAAAEGIAASPMTSAAMRSAETCRFMPFLYLVDRLRREAGAPTHQTVYPIPGVGVRQNVRGRR